MFPGADGGPLNEKKEVLFFFEKKNQKTFVCSEHLQPDWNRLAGARRLQAAPPARVAVAAG
jgi:hypothetical protein